MKSLKLGLLEFGVRKKLNTLSKIDDIFAYACEADRLGYSRFWLGEHYTVSADTAWQNPEPLIPLLAGMTNNISVGVAGLLIRYHCPYRVALSFKMLSNLFPGRIDLGFAKGTPGEKNVIPLLLGGYMNDEGANLFTDRMLETISILKNEEEYAGRNIILPPYKGDLPNLWGLSISNNGLNQALDNEMNYSRSLFHEKANISFEKEKLYAYKNKFEDLYGKKPMVNLAIAGYCAESAQSAESEFKTLLKNNPYYLPFEKNASCYVYGSPSQFADKLNELAENYGTEEFIFIDIADEPGKRKETLNLIGEELSLMPCLEQ
ncbi:LLM class flavin-dependent oxidoreductase [Mucilaginibacter sp.]|uniref:LLM class flavin-dependent oxidoreductase n=1 Tax=Mucilaginibacter sp. TaxID=1882438 RepID=UPI0025FA3C9A|nr:LLM class flavin-dependent oxidoreductase [Mucilaginibacter sp.]